jgi:hypothetical protein
MKTCHCFDATGLRGETIVDEHDRVMCRHCGGRIWSGPRASFVYLPNSFWIGVNWNSERRILTILPLPCLGISIEI